MEAKGRIKKNEMKNVHKQQELHELKKQIRQQLCDSLKCGTVLYLDGTISSPSKITEAVVCEEHSYMVDYVTDDHGYIREIRYDSIRLE